MGEVDPRSALVFQGLPCKQRGCGWRSPPISAALRKFVPFDEPLQRLHCLVEELEIPEE
jgi:hypothetical protein